MGNLATAIVGVKGPLFFYSSGLLKGVTAERFARKPVGASGVIDTNHPAFIFGHLSLYPAKTLQMIAAPEPSIENPAGFEDLFGAGTECRDDPDGTIYPAMEVVMSHYTRGHERLFEKLAELTDEHLAAPHSLENDFGKNFGSRAALAAFMCGAHPFSHFGQMSAWRRCEGLGSAF